MSRRHAAKKKVVLPDLKYSSVLLSKFINNIMEDGKKLLAQKIVYGAFDKLEKKYQLNPYESFKNAVSNVAPQVEVTSVRVGGANYQVPSPVEEVRSNVLAFRWIIDAALKRSERTMIDKLAEELKAADGNTPCGSIKKRDDTHRMAEANKAFAHFAARRSQNKTAENLN
ncbi:MAG: 30S ribosomal protein S7 [Rickettsiaceae bacterium]